MRRAARTDVNQKDIVNALRIAGFSVYPTHALGAGFPDIVVGKNGINLLFEIKDGDKPKSAQKLTPDEVIFHRDWRGSVYIVTSPEHALEMAISLTATSLPVL